MAAPRSQTRDDATPSEPTIQCPQCKTQIKLTESLAAPLVEATRRQFEQKLAAREAELGARRQEVEQRAQALEEARRSIEQQVAARLQDERARIAQDEAQKARLALGADLEHKARELAELQQVLQARDLKLAEAQAAQAELLRKQRALDDARRELELTVEKRVQEGLGGAREQARREAEQQLALKVAERESTIAALQKQIDELKQRAEQGSQQLQGEVLELVLEAQLRQAFPHDAIEPVAKGQSGADVLQRVVSPAGQACGGILWESKRTKTYNAGWLAKLRDDQRAAQAELAVLVSQALPREVDGFAQLDGVWVVSPRYALPLAGVLRQALIDVTGARQSVQGQQTKMELVYDYLTGPRFRQRVQSIVEAFDAMRDELEREKKVMTRHWAKRQEQLDRVLRGTMGMYGDLQGIAGSSIQELEGVELRALAPGDDDEG